MAKAKAQYVLEAQGVGNAESVIRRMAQEQKKHTDATRRTGAEYEKAQKAVNSLGDRVRAVSSIIGSIPTALGIAAAAFYATKRAGEALFTAMKEGAADADIERVFARGVRNAGDMLDALREGSRGTVDDTTLQRVGILLANATEKAEDFKTVASFALGEAYRSGREFSDVLTGLAKQLNSGEFGELKTMGIHAKTVESALSQMRDRAKELAPPLDSASIRLGRLAAEAANLKSAALQIAAVGSEFRRINELLLQGVDPTLASLRVQIEALEDHLDPSLGGSILDFILGDPDPVATAERKRGLEDVLRQLREEEEATKKRLHLSDLMAEGLDALSSKEKDLKDAIEKTGGALRATLQPELEAVQRAKVRIRWTEAVTNAQRMLNEQLDVYKSALRAISGWKDWNPGQFVGPVLPEKRTPRGRRKPEPWKAPDAPISPELLASWEESLRGDTQRGARALARISTKIEEQRLYVEGRWLDMAELVEPYKYHGQKLTLDEWLLDARGGGEPGGFGFDAPYSQFDKQLPRGVADKLLRMYEDYSDAEDRLFEAKQLKPAKLRESIDALVKAVDPVGADSPMVLLQRLSDLKDVLMKEGVEGWREVWSTIWGKVMDEYDAVRKDELLVRTTEDAKDSLHRLRQSYADLYGTSAMASSEDVGHSTYSLSSAILSGDRDKILEAAAGIDKFTDSLIRLTETRDGLDRMAESFRGVGQEAVGFMSGIYDSKDVEKAGAMADSAAALVAGVTGYYEAASVGEQISSIAGGAINAGKALTNAFIDDYETRAAIMAVWETAEGIRTIFSAPWESPTHFAAAALYASLAAGAWGSGGNASGAIAQGKSTVTDLTRRTTSGDNAGDTYIVVGGDLVAGDEAAGSWTARMLDAHARNGGRLNPKLVRF